MRERAGFDNPQNRKCRFNSSEYGGKRSIADAGGSVP
jgi:hypothetical protein